MLLLVLSARWLGNGLHQHRRLSTNGAPGCRGFGGGKALTGPGRRLLPVDPPEEALVGSL